MVWEQEEYWESIKLDSVGFVYKIIELDTGKYYVGIKKFYENRTLKPLKGRSKVEKERRAKLKGNKRHKKVESDWKTYNSSNKELQEKIKNNPDNYRKIILRLCDSVSSMKAYEAYYQLYEYLYGNWENLYNEMINLRLRLRKDKNEK